MKTHFFFKTVIVNRGKILIPTLLFFAMFFSFSTTKSQSNAVFEEVNGLVAVEAENFSTQKKTDKRKWYLNTGGEISDEASGKAFMEILPDTRVSHSDILISGENFSNNPGAMAIMEYQVFFNTPGRYYVWARCYSSGPEDNGIHVGINGIWPESGQRLQWCDGKNTWRWESKQRTNEVHCGVAGQIYLDVPTAGIHTVAFSMREDGFKLDKWLMTIDPDFVRPEDAGPMEKHYKGITKTSPVTGIYYLSALNDFDNITSGTVPYYKDKGNNALAIDASKKSLRDEFARATTNFYGSTGNYDITITTLAEFDGECTYKLFVNGAEIGSLINASVPREDDYKPLKTVFPNVKLQANDIIAIESNTHTNGLIPEGEGTAWARGRWSGITLTPCSEKNSVVRDFPGRIAWSADGNQHDTDDWLASPWALAIFRAAGMDLKVVYFGYNSHLWDEREGNNEIHESNVKGLVSLWGGFKNTAFFNEKTETEASTEKLVEEINKSTPENPLWLVPAGPIETIGLAIDKANPEALKNVTVLSHSTWNTDHGAKHHESKYSMEYLRKKGVNYKKIRDQNNEKGVPAWTAPGLKRKVEFFAFLAEHSDERMKYLWTCRVMPQYEIPKYQIGYYDFSDSGMAYWLITGANNGGDEYASPLKTFELLNGFVK